MKDRILNLFVYPGVAIIFCLAFGLPFVFAGFQDAHVQGVRGKDDSVTISVDRAHFFGLIHNRFQVEDVKEVNWVNTRIRRIGKPRRTISGVFLITETEEQPLFFGSSNLNEDLKWRAINEINAFIDSTHQQEFLATYRIRNAFGWFGFPFFVLGIWGLLAWPFSIIKGIKD